MGRLEHGSMRSAGSFNLNLSQKMGDTLFTVVGVSQGAVRLETMREIVLFPTSNDKTVGGLILRLRWSWENLSGPSYTLTLLS